MSTSSQNPEPERITLTAFEEIVSGNPRVSVWQALFGDAEDMLLASRPEGYEVEDIGRSAFNWLPESEREEALDCLYYTYWASVQNDADEQVRFEQERAPKARLRVCLDEFRALRATGAPMRDGLVAEIVDLTDVLFGGAR
ncbi:hypothetical protein [Streptomyces sp. H27-D2]|uniref:hypothetical protein n=1 Tax=Streptomyces sp. H27-D2 TaxID=3046304 RepID=UPI002DB8EEA7|nr:hypothetical protein [Streptomyces sp. H27-D2]MEC4016008.1 hypothetical protein [Streptomyces sp. H27-D2]